MPWVGGVRYQSDTVCASVAGAKGSFSLAQERRVCGRASSALLISEEIVHVPQQRHTHRRQTGLHEPGLRARYPCFLLMALLRTFTALAFTLPSRPLPVSARVVRQPWFANGWHAGRSRHIFALDDTEEAVVDLRALRKRVQRALYAAEKKARRAEDRASVCEDSACEDDDAEALATCAELRATATTEADRVEMLAELATDLQAFEPESEGSGGDAGIESQTTTTQLISRAESLGVPAVIAASPPPPPRPKKQKGPRPSTVPRLPYRVYRSEGGAEIRVGKQAKDNDVLSTDPSHRDADDFWLHASGCPGSHVIVRSDSVSSVGGERLSLDVLPREVELDAAVLAANYSKAARTGIVGVTLCRARQVSKPAGAKPGLVQLQGDVRVLKLNWKNEKRRLDRLRPE